MVLELFLGVNQDESSAAASGLINSHCSGKAIQRVIVELNLEEARDFLAKIQNIEREVVGLCGQ